MTNELVPLGAVDADKRPEEELASGYYTCLDDFDDFKQGDLVYLLDPEGDYVGLLHGERQWHIERASFVAHFAFEPDGITKRAGQMAALMTEIAELQARGLRENETLRGFNPHVDEAGAAEGMSLVPADGQGALEAKRSIAVMRNAATRLRSELESRQSAIKAFAEEQALILRKQASELQAILKVAEEAVWTINLYLGEDEEIVRLTEGRPAPADTPITIRQLVLYMDEECAVAAEDGGIDARSIDSFDEWLTADPAHLAQVLPEQKGMVALKPRRKKRDYGDPWMDKAMAEANKKTYFLLRNGENLFRMWTSYEVAEHLVPRTDEFLAFFSEREYDWETRTEKVTPLKPGSAAFMKAEKRAEAHKRHYMRAALILQGLIDRTPVFHPLAWKINVGDQESYEEALRVVLDGDLLLSDGRERFADWFRRINAELAVGMRIVGCFGSYEHGLRMYDAEKSWGHRNSRISPNGAGYPPDDELYTLEDKRDGGFVFYFERKGERWDGWESAPYQKRASCVVESSDKFILSFDAATVEEMEFYLRNRLDRQEYTYLFPALKLAIRMKRAEAEAEAPFRLLLAGEIAKAHGVSVAEAESTVPELVNWWKFKNRTHRALAADDAKAVRMIVAEFGHRAAQGEVRSKRAIEADAVLAAILKASPEAVLIAHKAGPEYVALVPENDENIFVSEQIWTAKGLKDTRPWRTVDARHQRWQTLYESARWAGWKTGAPRSEHLTDPEREALIAAAWDRLKVKKVWRDEAGTPRDTTPLAATVLPDGKIEVFFADGPGSIPTELFFSNRIEEPPLGRASIEWKRDATRRPAITFLPEHHLSVDKTAMPWEVRYDGRPYAGKVLWRDETAIAAFRDSLAMARTAKRAAEAVQSKIWAAMKSIDEQYAAGIEALARAKFAADYGDPELWEGHRKTLKLPERPRDSGDLRTAMGLLVERGIDLTSKTASEIVAEASSWAAKDLSVPDDLTELRVETSAKAARS